MKQTVVAFLLLVVSSGALAAGRVNVRHADDPSQAASELPTLSKFQTPGVVPYIGCGDPTSGDPCVDDGGGGGYTEGGCNCSRICYEGNSTCNLSVSNNGCQAGTNGNFCKSCWNNCY